MCQGHRYREILSIIHRSKSPKERSSLNAQIEGTNEAECHLGHMLRVPPVSSSQTPSQSLCLQSQWPASLALRFGLQFLARLAHCHERHPLSALRRSVLPKCALRGRPDWFLELAPMHLRESCSLAYPTGCHSDLSSIGGAYRRPDLARESLIYACSQACGLPGIRTGFNCISDSRSSATATKAGSISIAKQRRPVFSAAQRWVPEPENGS